MLDFFRRLFATDFMPHVYCLQQPALVALHAISDGLIALSCFLIPGALLYLVRRRRDLEFRWAFVLSGVFILACGATHALGILTLWVPVYRLEGVVKAITAAASIAAAFLLIRLAPHAVALPSQSQLRQEIEERERAEAGVRYLAREVEERARVELRIKDMKAELQRRSILDAVQDAVVLVDGAGTITHINTQGEALFGYPSGHLLRQKIGILLPAIPNPLEGGMGEGLDIVGARRDGSEFPAEVRLSPVHTDQGIAAAATVRDITESRRIRVELQTKAADMERFAYTVSHDLKSPLITIQSYITMIEEDMGAERFEHARADLQRVSRAACKMEGLLKDVLTLSRAGRVENNLERVAFRVLVEEALEALAGSLQSRQVRVEVGRELPFVTADRPRIVEALQNLIDNAAKFMKLDHPDPKILVGCENAGPETRFFVRDNGIGIDPKYQARIFGLFDKLNPKSEGSGAGLAIVKRIIQQHGGRIWVESDGYSGSTFWFTLEPSRKLHTKEESRGNDDNRGTFANPFG